MASMTPWLLVVLAGVLAVTAGWFAVRAHLALRRLESRFAVVLDIEAERDRVEAEIGRIRSDAEAALRGIQLETETAKSTFASLEQRVATLRRELQSLEEEEVLHANGFYKPVYALSSSRAYELRLDDLLERQKKMIKEGAAATCSVPWEVNGSRAEGAKQIKQLLTLMLRAFNGECDAAIAKVNYKNVKAMEARIKKARETIDKLTGTQQASITTAYANLKLEELLLVHEHAEKVQEEKEEQRRIREQMREEETAQRELERAKLEVEREERRCEDALAKARVEVEKSVGAKQEKLLAQIAELESRLSAAQEKERAISQAQLTRMGHVYVISNVGSFGDEVFKIGMTRRLVPQDRIDELGDASVPFEFDVHAIIRASDAPALENALHKRFQVRRVNRINERKEFFRASIDEIASAVKELAGEVQLTKVAEAAEFRKTLALIVQEGGPLPATAVLANQTASMLAAEAGSASAGEVAAGMGARLTPEQRAEKA